MGWEKGNTKYFHALLLPFMGEMSHRDRGGGRWPEARGGGERGALEYVLHLLSSHPMGEMSHRDRGGGSILQNTNKIINPYQKISKKNHPQSY
jgi:hypothetical protein